MNTADRSIAGSDTALRRRFVFMELGPDYEVFRDANSITPSQVNDTVNLEELLRSINSKIVK
ncbi:hypothetical protein [Paenibacillus wulumuqiensis]|uniref:hypothetical protein n=1 Tax=Paenibacillus wulumuqiensis TaxID=1567107 RepID=UPI00128C2980|nr:hypothetical protein [Paenibacillus wulumuqiensis]